MSPIISPQPIGISFQHGTTPEAAPVNLAKLCKSLSTPKPKAEKRFMGISGRSFLRKLSPLMPASARSKADSQKTGSTGEFKENLKAIRGSRANWATKERFTKELALVYFGNRIIKYGGDVNKALMRTQRVMADSGIAVDINLTSSLKNLPNANVMRTFVENIVGHKLEEMNTPQHLILAMDTINAIKYTQPDTHAAKNALSIILIKYLVRSYFNHNIIDSDPAVQVEKYKFLINTWNQMVRQNWPFKTPTAELVPYLNYYPTSQPPIAPNPLIELNPGQQQPKTQASHIIASDEVRAVYFDNTAITKVAMPSNPDEKAYIALCPFLKTELYMKSGNSDKITDRVNLLKKHFLDALRHIPTGSNVIQLASEYFFSKQTGAYTDEEFQLIKTQLSELAQELSANHKTLIVPGTILHELPHEHDNEPVYVQNTAIVLSNGQLVGQYDKRGFFVGDALGESDIFLPGSIKSMIDTGDDFGVIVLQICADQTFYTEKEDGQLQRPGFHIVISYGLTQKHNTCMPVGSVLAACDGDLIKRSKSSPPYRVSVVNNNIQYVRTSPMNTEPSHVQPVYVPTLSENLLKPETAVSWTS